MSANFKDALKARLASGEISLETYRELVAEICEKAGDTVSEHANDLSNGLSTGALIVEFEGLRVFENVIVHNNVSHQLTDVISVRGGQSQQSFNIVPTGKSSTLYIEFVSGESIVISEKRILFGGNRHEAIGRLLATIRKLTFSQRLANLAKKLAQQGQIELTRTWTIGGKEIGEAITLRKDGTVVTPKGSINLKRAKASGTFGLGTEWHSLNGMSHNSNPYEVVLSERRGFLGALVPVGALKFIPFVDDIDIVHSLLAWMAEPGNRLE